MAPQTYRGQVELLLQVLPEVAKETCFALHGGTAINLFIRDLPRLSVDIDLTYVPIEDRATSLQDIGAALERIKANIETVLPSVRVIHQRDICKLQVSLQGVQIKVEVNQIGRGTLDSPKKWTLCETVQNSFDAFCVIQLVPFGQLYGGKIFAALDRQHPRDLFYVKYLLENEGFSEGVKTGFLLCLLSGDRPFHEIISPNFQDQRMAMANQFEGMSAEEFTYGDFENTREKLVQEIHHSLSKNDKQFLLSVANAEPEWGLYDFEKFPAVQWKLLNLQKLKNNNPEKHRDQYNALKSVLSE
ncbi:MAG: nucleotidyl transferase AbiEii/AbiGii toxin family protein [Robiginitomaculum sp.]|nr:nucleotidyl transferase AbiEii/AbiGii toxin family protein [Robiginitomaculum sp.]